MWWTSLTGLRSHTTATYSITSHTTPHRAEVHALSGNLEERVGGEGDVAVAVAVAVAVVAVPPASGGSNNSLFYVFDQTLSNFNKTNDQKCQNDSK